MAEREKGYCTGCGYKSGHRPYCWRVVTMSMGIDATHKRIRKCLKEMGKHHRFISRFLAKQEHMYYTIESIDNGVAEQAKDEGRGFYKCDNCGYSEFEEREVVCWECGKGSMCWQDAFSGVNE